MLAFGAKKRFSSSFVRISCHSVFRSIQVNNSFSTFITPSDHKMNALSTKQKLVLQGLMWKRCTIREEANEMLNKLSITEDFDQYIRTINQMINTFRMQISKGMDEETGFSYYAVVNLADNHLSRLYALYTSDQLNVIRRALDMVITSPRCMFSAKRLIARCFELGTKMTSGSIRQLLSDLVNQQFLTRVDNHYTLGVRGCIEMEPYYSINYTSLVEVCNTCKVFCVRGEHCASCNIKLHYACLNRCISELQGTCPGCNTQWKSRVDELADEGSDDEMVQSQSQVLSTQVILSDDEQDRPIISRANRRRSQMETTESPPSSSQPASGSKRATRANWKRGRRVSSGSDTD